VNPSLNRHRFFVCLCLGFTLTNTQAADELPAVKVSGKVAAVQSLIDRKIYRVTNDVQALTGSVADLLNSLPSIDVDADGNTSLRGDPNVTILIDGKPSAQLSGSKAGDGLLQLSARDVERIEVMTNPPPEFRSAGTGGVINIITRRKAPTGPSGNLQLSAGNRSRYVLGAAGSYGSESLKLSGALGLREEDRQRAVRSQSSGLDDTGGATTTSEQRLDEHLRRLIPSAKLDADWRASDQDSVSANVSVRQRSGDRFFDQLSTTRAVDGSLLEASTRHSDGHEWSRTEDQGLRFKRSIKDRGESIEAWLHRSTDRERERYAYLDTPTSPAGPVKRDHLYLNHDLATRELGLDYLHRWSDERSIKLGYALERDDNGFDNSGDTVDPASGQTLLDPALTNRYRYQQTIRALYASLQAAWNDWSVQGGLRGEQTSARGDSLDGAAPSQRRYTGLYPSLRMERSIDVTTWSMGYGKRLSRPDAEALNPFVDHQDVHNLRAGNAGLLPQETQSLELGWRIEHPRDGHGATAYIRHTRNSLTTLTQLVSPGVTLSTLANLPVTRAFGVEFNREGALAPAWSYRVSGNAFHSEIDATSLGITGLKSTAGLNLKASLDYRPDATDQAQVSFSRTDKRLTPQGQIAAINLVNMGYRHSLGPGVAIFSTVSDLFNGQRFHRQLDTPVLQQSYARQQLGRVFFLGLTFSASGSKGKGQGFDYEKGD
jgi:outer membrane receptor for ferrienterochelin and colicin